MNEIIEGNKIIAEFMGWKRAANGIDWIHADYNDHGTEVEMSEFIFNNYRSWSWLMPVVEKIEGFGDWHFFIVGKECDIATDNLDFDAPSFKQKSNSKIEATWLAVVEFIKWYNQNNPK